jgi:hypothetical protein
VFHSSVRMRTARRALRAGLATAAAAAAMSTLGSCSSGSAASPSSPPRSPTSSASSAPSDAARPVILDERARGTTVRVTTGTQIVVRLHSTYWSTPAGSDPLVLTPVGGETPTTTAAACPPGRGCGISSAQFTALRPGTAHVSARRDSCGEAMRCSPGQGRYDVTVTVTR